MVESIYIFWVGPQSTGDKSKTDTWIQTNRKGSADPKQPMNSWHLRRTCRNEHQVSLKVPTSLICKKVQIQPQGHRFAPVRKTMIKKD